MIETKHFGKISDYFIQTKESFHKFSHFFISIGKDLGGGGQCMLFYHSNVNKRKIALLSNKLMLSQSNQSVYRYTHLKAVYFLRPVYTVYILGQTMMICLLLNISISSIPPISLKIDMQRDMYLGKLQLKFHRNWLRFERAIKKKRYQC